MSKITVFCLLEHLQFGVLETGLLDYDHMIFSFTLLNHQVHLFVQCYAHTNRFCVVQEKKFEVLIVQTDLARSLH